MTCREFKHNAEALTLWELSQLHNEDERILNHARQCESCGSWLGQQRSLAASLGTLQAQTAGLEAGADVEQAVLRAFRQTMAQNATSVSLPPAQVLANSEKRKAKSDVLAPVAAPVALRLSHWFEIGAYVAVAAAVIVGMFLGIRLLGHRSNREPAQAKAAPAITQPVVQKAVVAAQAETPNVAPVAANKSAVLERPGTVQPPAARKRTSAALQPVAADDSQSDSDAGYTALMFCDPLSCSSDSQVVRMELPEQAGQSIQAEDLVVGDDGTVRAVRIVN
jgi:hypothetical protein